MAEDPGAAPADEAMLDADAAGPASDSPPPDPAAALAAGQAAGNIHMAGGDAETLEHAVASREAADRQARLIAQVEERRRLRATVVPTDVAEVKQLLRQLEQPITLFAEREVSACFGCARIRITMHVHAVRCATDCTPQLHCQG